MSVPLVGGGGADLLARGPVYDGFLNEAQDRARVAGRRRPRVGMVVLHEPDDSARGPEQVARFTGLLGGPEALEASALVEVEGAELGRWRLSGLDGLLVAGGLTPAYQVALLPVADEVRALVAAGVPYLGFSAGAAVAAEVALVGGYRLDGVPVCAEDAGEELEPVTVRPGLGLVPWTVDVHAAQWGTLSRLVAATGAGLTSSRSAALDEDTVLVVDGPGHRVAGRGQVWWVERGADGVVVRPERAGSTPPALILGIS